MDLDVGAVAPDFTLVNQDWQSVTLGAHRGRDHVVLAFFPAAFSSTCTSELCTFRDNLATFSAVGTTVYAISVDSPWALKAYKAEQGFPFSLLSDFNRVVIRAYGVLCEDMIGLKNLAKRAVFLVERTGHIRHCEVLEDARNEPDYARLESAVRALGP
jgi:peroxiredoxin